MKLWIGNIAPGTRDDELKRLSRSSAVDPPLTQARAEHWRWNAHD